MVPSIRSPLFCFLSVIVPNGPTGVAAQSLDCLLDFLCFQIIDSKMLCGTKYHLVRWLDCAGNREESWIPAAGFHFNPSAYNLPIVDGDFLNNEDYEMWIGCNTSKDKLVRRQKIAGMNIVCFPCGTILSVDELYGSESLSQVLLPLYSLFKDEGLRNDVTVLLHDNACKFAAFIKNRSQLNPIMQHLSTLDMRVDRHHFRNHVGKKCRLNHNPDKCTELNNVNTSIMEQVNNWFGRYRHSARYMNQARFTFYLTFSNFPFFSLALFPSFSPHY